MYCLTAGPLDLINADVVDCREADDRPTRLKPVQNGKIILQLTPDAPVLQALRSANCNKTC